MAVEVVTRSRLRFAELGVVDGYEFWDLIDLPTLISQPDDITYQIQDSDRLDLLATDFYGDPALWWVIALKNDLELVPADVVMGEIIIIPSPRYVLQELFTTAKTT